MSYNFSITYDKKINKKDRYVGPSAVQGNSLPDKVIRLIKEFDGPGVILFFDDIVIDCNGKKMRSSGNIRYDH